jgi:hypothetical protein
VWLDQYPDDFNEPPNFPCLTQLENFVKRTMPDSELDLKVCGKYYCYSSRRIRVFPANFPLSVFARQIIDAMLLCPLISMDPLLSYINQCTAHYSSVLFWIQFCLDQIKVIAHAHPCHHQKLLT